MSVIVPLNMMSHDAVERLLDAAFGPDRHGRTAYMIRDGMPWLPELSFGMRDEDGRLIGSLQSWPVALVHADGGRWVLRYTAVGEVDPYGGSVVLTPTVEMRNYREGDLVNVTGQILNDGQAARPLGGALYRVGSIQMVERADP